MSQEAYTMAKAWPPYAKPMGTGPEAQQREREKTDGGGDPLREPHGKNLEIHTIKNPSYSNLMLKDVE